jgi:DNA-binding IclR family transcriptional regulator
MQVGARIGIGSSPLGWALLAALPDPERYYLLENVERQMPREWPQLRRRSSEAMAQVYGNGYCTSVGELDPHLGIVATPVVIEDRGPMVLACLGASDRMTRPRVERELAPRLLAMARTIGQNGIVK